jgi:MFS family permease
VIVAIGEYAVETGANALRELRSRWDIVVAMAMCGAVGPTNLVTYSSGVFMAPLQHEFGWGRGKISLGVTTFGLAVALISPLTGALIYKFGPRWVIFASLVACASALFALALMPNSYALFMGIYLILGIAGSGAGALMISTVLTRVFDRARGISLALGLLGAGICNMIAPKLLLDVVNQQGWRAGYSHLGVIVLVFLPFIMAPFIYRSSSTYVTSRKTDEAKSVRIGGHLKSSKFWKLSLAFVLVQFAVVGAIAHFVPILQDRNLPPRDVGLFAGLVGASTIVSRLLIGALIDHFSARHVGAFVCILAGLGFALFAHNLTFAGTICGAIGVGLVSGAELDLAGYLMSKLFPLDVFSRLYGVAMALMTLSASLSIFSYGFFFDVFKSYNGMLSAASIEVIVAALLLLSLPGFAKPGSDVG